MMRIDDEFLYVTLGIPKSFLVFITRAVKTGHETGLVVRDSHAAATAASHRFDHYGITDFLGDLHGILFVFDYSVAARSDRHACLARIATRRVLVTHRVHCARRRTDELY